MSQQPKATPKPAKKKEEPKGFFMPLGDIEQVLTSLKEIPVGQVFNVYHYFFSKKLELTNPQLVSPDKGEEAKK